MAASNHFPSPTPPGKGFFGWLGRQVGHVSKAVLRDVVPAPTAPAKALYRETRVEELPHPTEPDVTLRRTTIDEALPGPPAPKA